MQVLRLVLYDYDALDTDDRIGEARVDVKDLKDQEEKDLWLDVDHHDPKEGNENRYKASSMQLLRSYPHQVPCFCIFTGRVFCMSNPGFEHVHSGSTRPAHALSSPVTGVHPLANLTRCGIRMRQGRKSSCMHGGTHLASGSGAGLSGGQCS